MAEGEAEWELCKENIQPLRRGRAISALQQALSQQEGSGYAAIQQQKQSFESELRMYNGDDPLDVWDRYIKWTQETYPQGGKESNLSVLLERAVMRFADEKSYYNDPRYIHLWIKFAENSTEPLDIYRYMQGLGIGVQQAAFYIAWSEEFEKHGNSKKADAVYQEGFKCAAEPLDKLQQYHKAFQARVSRQVMTDMMAGGEEPDSPEAAVPHRSSLADLKHRGKKKAIVPISRIGGAIASHPRGLNLQQAFIPRHNSQVVVFDENQAAAAEPTEPHPEPWMAPPTSRASKENDILPEKWTSVKMPQKSRSGHAFVPMPSKPNFQPFVEELDQPPAVTPCKINPSVNTVLSARKPSEPETPLKRLQEQQQPVEGQPGEQCMFCKELLFNGTVEFCFEELRAERYYKKVAQKLEEKEMQLSGVKEDLRRQIEEKQKLLMQNVPQGVLESQPDSAASVAEVPFKVYDESEAETSTGGELVIFTCRANGHACSDNNSLEIRTTGVPFTVFDENRAYGVPQGVDSSSAAATESKPSACRPLAAALGAVDVPLARAEKNAQEVEPLNEDAILHSYRNKTLCPSPENTCDFARAAVLASTPFARGLSQQAGCESDNIHVFPASEERVKQLSPIQEASLEDQSSLAGSCVQSLQLTSRLESNSSQSLTTSTRAEMRDPTSVKSRLEALEKVDLALIPGFYRKDGTFPMGKEFDVHFFEEVGETIVSLSQISRSDSCTIHFGKASRRVIVKASLDPVPWDFYIGAQLRDRLGDASRKYFGGENSCLLYETGCITFIWGHYQCLLEDLLARSLPPQVVTHVAVELLEIVEQMHSCHLVHGAIQPDVFLIKTKENYIVGDSTLKVLDFSHTVDLDLQEDVTTVEDIPTAQKMLKQGVLSPLASPYQIDLLGIAETVYMLLQGQKMELVRHQSGWSPAEDVKGFGVADGTIWQDFFRTLLNPGEKSTLSVLSELQQLLRTQLSHRNENVWQVIDTHLM